jgi:ElaB/YqjD/DUF883 family membrane-anchored ribosome-binding protein
MARSTDKQVVDDFNAVIADTEQLLKSVGSAGNERTGALRDSIEKNLSAAKERLVELQESAAERTRAAARATEDYVSDNPWRSVGVAVGVGVVAGIFIGLLIERR